jgi:pimeloyl-ACP methyl ester carboxylesterase
MRSSSHTTRRLLGQEWDIRESGPSDAESTVLLLPGGMCTAVFFEPIMDALVAAPVRVVAATLPGFGRTPHSADFSIENHASLAGRLARDVGADIVGGHSLGGNVALEMAASGEFDGPLLLLSPTFSREDEAKELGILDRIGSVPGVGQLTWFAMLKAMPKAMGKRFPAERREALVAGMANNDPRFCRRGVRTYFQYLDAHGSLVPRLCESGVKSYVVFGDNDEIGLTDEERRGLEACADVTLITVADATHGLIIEQPARIAELIVELAEAKTRPATPRRPRSPTGGSSAASG